MKETNHLEVALLGKRETPQNGKDQVNVTKRLRKVYITLKSEKVCGVSEMHPDLFWDDE